RDGRRPLDYAGAIVRRPYLVQEPLMNLRLAVTVLGIVSVLADYPPAKGADEPSFARKEDVIYGRKFGTALTMDVFTPKRANGAVGGRAPRAEARGRRGRGRPQGRGPGGPRVEPRPGRRLLLPSDRLPQFRLDRQGDAPRHRPRAAVPRGVRLPEARPREPAL